MKHSEKPKPTPLFAAHPDVSQSGLIMRFAWEDDVTLASAFQGSAKRLAATHAGDSTDDMILLPYLTLYRQAFELALKVTIRELAALRREVLGDTSPDLTRDSVNKKLQYKIKHNLLELWDELTKHFTELYPGQELPDTLTKLFHLLHETDSSGTAFRYTGGLEANTERLDFPSLASSLDTQFDLLIAVRDYATETIGH